MAYKSFVIENQTVTIFKRRGSRSLKISLTADGTARITIPSWAPYSAGLQFAKSRLSWISSKVPPKGILKDNQPIGKAHHLKFIADRAISKPFARLSGQDIRVVYPDSLAIEDQLVQLIAHKAGIRALRTQAEQLLPQRLIALAAQHGFHFKSVSIKQLKSRWGSCDSEANIVLNLYLMQLPWDCIDYVLLHELTHTRIQRHGSPFWAALNPYIRDLPAMRKKMRGYQPVLQTE